jgi:hypothetical protein
MALFSLSVDFFEKNKHLNPEAPRGRNAEPQRTSKEKQKKGKRKAKESKIAANKRFSLLLFFLRVSVPLCEMFGFLNLQYISKDI